MQKAALILGLATVLTTWAVSPSTSAPSVFESLTGVFGSVRTGPNNCAANPRYQYLSPDHDRILFHWSAPHQSSYLGRMITEKGGDVTSFDDPRITHTRDLEPVMDVEGKPIRWTYHVTADNSGFCVSRSDWPGAGCFLHYVRCDLGTPSS